MAKKRDPWDEGHMARLKGVTPTANPYSSGTPESLDWIEGWRDLDEHLRDRDAALRDIGWY
jgi:hypothetical protein